MKKIYFHLFSQLKTLHKGAVIINAGGALEDISKLMVNVSWPLGLSKYFFMAPPFRYQ
jgi:hypothetical protein